MISTKSLAWAAGFLEGEGSFYAPKPSLGSTIAVSAPQMQREPLERLQQIFGGSINGRAGAGIFTWVVYGTPAAAIMMTLAVMMSPRRKAAIVRALEGWRKQRLSYAFRTHCPKGHAYTPDNLLGNKDRHRVCRACNRAWCREHSRRRAIQRQNIRTANGLPMHHRSLATVEALR